MSDFNSFYGIDSKSPAPSNTAQAETLSPVHQFYGLPAQTQYGTGAKGNTDPSWFDATVGSFEYGAADSAEHLISYTQSLTGSDYLKQVDQQLQGFKQSHPEYAPEEVDSAWGLISNPKALASHVAAGGAQLLATAGLMAIPVVGVPLTLGLTYAIENDRTYKQALADGASEDDAVLAGRVGGVVQSLVQLAIQRNIIGFKDSGALQAFTRGITKEGISLAAASQLGKDGAMFAAKEALYGALQQGAAEAIPAGVYGRPVPSGLMDRLAQAAVTNVAASGVLGIAKSVVPGLSADNKNDPSKQLEMDSYSRKSLQDNLKNNFKLSDDQVSSVLAITDRRASLHAAQYGVDPSDWYSTRLANAATDDNSQKVLFQSGENVAGFHSKLLDIVNSDKFQKSMSPDQALSFLTNQGVKQDELIWTGTKDLLEGMTKAGVQKITKTELASYLEKNQVTLDETILGGKARRDMADAIRQAKQDSIDAYKTTTDLADKLDEIRERSGEQSEQYTQAKIDWQTQAQKYADLSNAYHSLVDKYSETGVKYDNYKAVPGPSSDYTELLLKFPQQLDITQEGIKAKLKNVQQGEFSSARNSQTEAGDFEGYTNAQLEATLGKSVVDAMVKSGALQDMGKAYFRGSNQMAYGPVYQVKENFQPQRIAKELFQPGHFGEIALNTIVHTRFDTRELPTGEKALMVQEIQSDWHQQGRAQGYRNGPADKTQIEEIRKQWEEQNDILVSLESKYQKDIDWSEEDKALYDKTELRFQELSQQKESLEKGINPGPFSKNYNELALKRLLLEAVQNGHDFIALPTGEQQNMLYGGGNSEMDHSQLYDEILPKALVKLVKGWDKTAKIEPLEISTNPTGEKEGRQNEVGFEDVPPVESVQALRITDAIRDGITREGFPLFQSNKAQTVFLQDGRAVLTALQHPDVSSALHELGHVFRHDLNADDLAIAAKWAGVKDDGVWTVPNEEKFARGFESYIKAGAAPSGELVGVFNKFKDWMSQIYQVVRGSPIDVKVSAEMRGVFDRLFVEDTPSIAAKRAQVAYIENELKDYSKTKDSPGAMVYAKQLEFRLKDANRDLQAIQRAQFDPKAESQGALLTKEAEVLGSKLSGETPEVGKVRQTLLSIKDTLSEAALSMSSTLQKTQAGKLLWQGLTNRANYIKNLRGEFEDSFKDAYLGMSRKEVNALTSVDENGISLFRRLADSTAIPSQPLSDKQAATPGVRGMIAFFGELSRKLGSEAERLGTMTARKDGSITPYEQPDTQRLPRIPTMEMRKAVADASGPVWKALIERVTKLNPGMTEDAVAASLKSEYGDPSVRSSGALENVRKIGVMPDAVTIDGKDLAVMHIEPQQLYRSMLEYQGGRLGFIEQFGQNLVDNVGLTTLKKVASVLGVSPEYSTETLKQQLLDKDVDPLKLEGSSYKDMKALAKAMSIPLSPGLDELKDAIKNVDPNSLNKSQLKQIKELGKNIQGVNLNQDPVAILNDIKGRLDDQSNDVIRSLRDSHVKEGGSGESFDNVLQVAQGLPYHWLGRGPIAQSMKFMSNLLGITQTSTALAPNLPQTLVQVPQLAGPVKFLQAISNAITSPSFTRSQLVGMGAFANELAIRGADPGYELETRGANLRRLVGKATGIQQINEFNSTVAAEAGRLMAEEWKNYPKSFDTGDVRVARTLGLDDRELGSIRAGSMADETYKKIVQNMVSRTQFHTEDAFNRSKIENIPLLNMLFAYSSYTLGTTRANVSLVNDLQDAVTKGDVGGIVDGVKRASLLLAGSVGAGMASQVLRQALKSNLDKPRPEDQGFWDRTLAALNETQALGMTTRLIDPFKYDGGVVEKAMIGMMPQVSALAQLIGAFKGYGKFGDFPLGERVKQAALQETPAAQALTNWWNASAYPSEVAYTRDKSLVSSFQDKVLGKQADSTQTQLNPLYYPIFKAVERGDYDEALKQATAYYQKVLTQGNEGAAYQAGTIKRFLYGSDSTAAIHDAVSYINKTIPPGPERDAATQQAMIHYERIDVIKMIDDLRTSLLNRSPINMNNVDTIRFLMSQPEDRRLALARDQMQYVQMVNRIAPSPR